MDAAGRPSDFVAAWLPSIVARLPAERRALDLACGRGRHIRLLVEAGFVTFGVDRDLERVRAARAASRDRGESARLWVADLEQVPLPRGRFDVVVGVRYLQRSLWRAIREAVAPGGFLIYETFTMRQPRHGWGPRSPDHLLRPGELRDAVPGWHVHHYSEVDEPAAVARLVAEKPDPREPTHASLAPAGSLTRPGTQ